MSRACLGGVSLLGAETVAEGTFFARSATAVAAIEDRVMLEAELLADTLSPRELHWALDFMTTTADYFDTKLVARYGGFTAYDDVTDNRVEV